MAGRAMKEMVRQRRGAARAPKGLRWLGRPRSRGQALVEFAIVVPVMLFVLLIAIDFGRLLASYVQITNAARESAAYGAGNPTDVAGIAAHAGYEKNSQGQQGEGALTIDAACRNSAGQSLACALAPGGGGTGNTITVTASEPFTFLTPLIGDLFGGHVTLGYSATAAVLNLAPSGGSGEVCTQAPTAAFTVVVNLKTVTLDASSSTPVSGICFPGYNWDMGDGSGPFPPGDNRKVTYSYAGSGTYKVWLTVTNQAGDAKTWQDVTIDSIPDPSATLPPTLPPTQAPTSTPAPTAAPPVCSMTPSFVYQFNGNGNGKKAHQMTFQGSSSGQPAPSSWTWSFGGPGSADNGSLSDPAFDYDSSGTYTVTLTLENGSCVRSTTQQVVVP